MEKVKITYGLLSDSIEKQLNKQGLTLSSEAEFMDRLKDSLEICSLDLMTDTEYQSSLKKLHNMVLSKIESL